MPITCRPALRDTEARNALVEQWLPLVGWVIKKLGFRARHVAGLPLEEAESAGRLGLLRAAELWDETRGIRFNTFAAYWIKQHIFRAAEQWRLVHVPCHKLHDKSYRPARCFSLDSNSNKWNYNPVYEALSIPDADRRDEMEVAMRCLRQREREVLKLRFWEGLTLLETGARLGVTRERIRQIEARALEKLRAHLSPP